MTQKTAIMQAIENLEQQRKSLNEMDLLGILLDNEFAHKSNQINTIQLTLSQLLATEKQQVIDTYKYALPANMSEAQKQDEAEFFYNEKYGQ